MKKTSISLFKTFNLTISLCGSEKLITRIEVECMIMNGFILQKPFIPPYKAQQRYFEHKKRTKFSLTYGFTQGAVPPVSLQLQRPPFTLHQRQQLKFHFKKLHSKTHNLLSGQSIIISNTCPIIHKPY